MMVVSPGRREDVRVRKEAPVRRNSSACSPKQLPTSKVSPRGNHSEYISNGERGYVREEEGS